MPEVIYTSHSEIYLHLPGVIVTQKATEVRYLLSDGLGSIRQVVDETATVVAYQEFDPYGNPVVGEGDPYGYTGEWWEEAVGLLHLRARWYLPETGTFLSKDPWEGSLFKSQTLNGFSYVGNNPINLTDPLGLCYPPFEWLRRVEKIVCDNLDLALFIAVHPNASTSEKAGASLYISTWTVSHSALLLGGGILVGKGGLYIAGKSVVVEGIVLGGSTGGTIAGGAEYGSQAIANYSETGSLLQAAALPNKDWQ